MDLSGYSWLLSFPSTTFGVDSAFSGTCSDSSTEGTGWESDAQPVGMDERMRPKLSEPPSPYVVFDSIFSATEGTVVDFIASP